MIWLLLFLIAAIAALIRVLTLGPWASRPFVSAFLSYLALLILRQLVLAHLGI